MIHLEVLPPAQRAFWEDDLGGIPKGWVLYGGTAVALHLGHRHSLDFDFFSSAALDRAALRAGCSILSDGKTLQDEPDTLTVVVNKEGEPLKLSFFGGIGFGRVGEPLRIPDRAVVASRLDLLGTKLATVTQRIEARDYLDIAALLACEYKGDIMKRIASLACVFFLSLTVAAL
ncbi:MAG: nucleotidyl transferase AbiEii/AbiGii toxin family protein, partial [Candidatus Binatia bacterium]